MKADDLKLSELIHFEDGCIAHVHNLWAKTKMDDRNRRVSEFNYGALFVSGDMNLID